MRCQGLNIADTANSECNRSKANRKQHCGNPPISEELMINYCLQETQKIITLQQRAGRRLNQASWQVSLQRFNLFIKIHEIKVDVEESEDS